MVSLAEGLWLPVSEHGVLCCHLHDYPGWASPMARWLSSPRVKIRPADADSATQSTLSQMSHSPTNDSQLLGSGTNYSIAFGSQFCFCF